MRVLNRVRVCQADACYIQIALNTQKIITVQNVPHVVDPLVHRKWLEAVQSPQHRERLSKRLTGQVKDTDLTRRNSPRHARALHLTVRSPAGVPYLVDNLSAFVRAHPELFDPEDVVNRSRKRASYQSRATAGLRKLRAIVGTRLSWKGWTLAYAGN